MIEFGRDILVEVAQRHNLTVTELLSRSHKRVIAWPRHEAMWEIRRRTKLSLPQIGKLMGDRDHTTVLHGIKGHERRLGESAPRTYRCKYCGEWREVAK